MMAYKSKMHRRTLCFFLAFIFLLPCSFLRAEVSDTIVATGRSNFSGEASDKVKKSAIKEMLINAIRQELQQSLSQEEYKRYQAILDKNPLSNPERFIQQYHVIAELNGKGFFQVTGSVEVKKKELVDYLEHTFLSESSLFTVLLLISEENPETGEWKYWWKVPQDKNNDFPFTRSVGDFLRREGMTVIDRMGSERILLENPNYQTPFITLDSCLQLGSVYRSSYVVTGNIHTVKGGDTSEGPAGLVVSLQILSTMDGETIGEIQQRRKIGSSHLKGILDSEGKKIAFQIKEKIKSYTNQSIGGGSSANIVGLEQNVDSYMVTITIENMSNMQPLEVIENYLTGKNSPAREIETVILEHRTAKLLVQSKIDGKHLAEMFHSEIESESGLSIVSSTKNEIRISTNYAEPL